MFHLKIKIIQATKSFFLIHFQLQFIENKSIVNHCFVFFFSGKICCSVFKLPALESPVQMFLSFSTPL